MEDIEITEMDVEVVKVNGQVTEVDVEVTEVDVDIKPENHEITIFIDHKEYKVHAHEMTGAQLKALAQIPEANLLFLEVRGPGDDELIQNDTVVHLHDGDCFYDMPPGNFGRW